MQGDQNDMFARLRAVLPSNWFAGSTTYLDALLGGLAAAWSWLFGAVKFVASQTRIATATGLWLDLVAWDYFGSGLKRWSGQSDTGLRARIQSELFRNRTTRDAVWRAILDLTGRAPIIFEPSRPADTGAWRQMSGYGVAGAWGSLQLPFQIFVTALRPLSSGVAVVSGWNESAAGYGVGVLEYASPSMVQGQVTDAQINQTIASVMPIATIAWTRITD